MERHHVTILDGLNDSLRQEDEKIADIKALIAELSQLRMPEPKAPDSLVDTVNDVKRYEVTGRNFSLT